MTSIPHIVVSSEKEFPMKVSYGKESIIKYDNSGDVYPLEGFSYTNTSIEKQELREDKENKDQKVGVSENEVKQQIEA
jgi:hypothetical protein